jgi:hypothetical protein
MSEHVSRMKKNSLLYKTTFFCYNLGIHKTEDNAVKKIVTFLNLLAWAALLTHVGLIFYANSFDLTSTLGALETSYMGAITALIDFSTDLPYLLKAFAVLLYGIAIILGFFKVLFQGRIFSAFSLLIHLSLVLVFLLTVIADTTLLTTILTNVTNPTILIVVENASLLAFAGLSILSFLIVILSFISQPQTSKSSKTSKVKEQEDPLVVELQKFVVPNQVSIQVPPVIQPQQTFVQPVAPVLPAQPVVQTPPLVAMQEDATVKARETVHALKEKIRAIIRFQLMNRPTVQSTDSLQVSPSSNPQPSQVDEAMIRKMVQDIFQQEFKTVKADQKEELSNLVNEELIKYDALNREVIDSMINEKIENQTEQALQHVSRNASKVGQNLSSDYVTKDELTNALASLPQQAISEEQVRTLVLQILANRGSSTETITVQEESDDNKPVELVEQPTIVKKKTKTVRKKAVKVTEPGVEIVKASRTKKSKQPKQSAVKPTKPAKKQTVKPQVIAPSNVSSVSNDQTTNVIAIEDQFKSVLPSDSLVTRTGKKRIIRVPFPTRMKETSQDVRDNYDTLQNYLLSFKVKSRVSNVGDMFRLRKEEYVKIVTAGKGLKLYFALNPKDYENSTIPVDDASDKKIYANIPLVFKVKSDLSVKRAKMLIDDLMNKKGLTQKTLLDLPWSKQFLD